MTKTYDLEVHYTDGKKDTVEGVTQDEFNKAYEELNEKGYQVVLFGETLLNALDIRRIDLHEIEGPKSSVGLNSDGWYAFNDLGITTITSEGIEHEESDDGAEWNDGPTLTADVNVNITDDFKDMFEKLLKEIECNFKEVEKEINKINKEIKALKAHKKEISLEEIIKEIDKLIKKLNK